jgi:hypothetical protein
VSHVRLSSHHDSHLPLMTAIPSTVVMHPAVPPLATASRPSLTGRPRSPLQLIFITDTARQPCTTRSVIASTSPSHAAPCLTVPPRPHHHAPLLVRPHCPDLTVTRRSLSDHAAPTSLPRSQDPSKGSIDCVSHARLSSHHDRHLP